MKTITFTQALRDAIKASGLSHNELAKQSGMAQPVITRFVNGLDIRLATADKLAVVLGIEPTRRKSAKK